MQYQISLSEDGRYVRIRVFDAVTGELAGAFTEEAIKIARQHQVLRYLVDVRQTSNVSSSVEQYQLGHEAVKRMGLDPLSRIAILAAPQDPSHEFIETVFRNAWYNCRLFEAEDAALEWLMA